MIPADWTINVTIWAAIAVGLAVWQIVAIRSRKLPAFGDVLALLRSHWLLRWGILGFWGWLGWHLFVRTPYGT